MDSPFDKYDDLPPEIKKEIGDFISGSDLTKLGLVNRNNWTLFKPAIDVCQLLHSVVRGDRNEVQAILKENPQLMCQRYHVTDRSNRVFKNISAFEYTLWALDRNMWNTMISCIPQTPEGKAILDQLIAQYDNMDTNNVTYWLDAQKITEKHFDFENTILAALRSAKSDKNEVEVIKRMIKAQKELPVHVVHEYCSKTPFTGQTKFTSDCGSQETQFMIFDSETLEDWFNSHGLVITKGLTRAYGDPTLASGGAIRKDLCALQNLFSQRTQDFHDLRGQIEQLLTVDNEPNRDIDLIG